MRSIGEKENIAKKRYMMNTSKTRDNMEQIQYETVVEAVRDLLNRASQTESITITIECNGYQYTDRFTPDCWQEENFNAKGAYEWGDIEEDGLIDQVTEKMNYEHENNLFKG
jgi:hypothetical protein